MNEDELLIAIQQAEAGAAERAHVAAAAIADATSARGDASLDGVLLRREIAGLEEALAQTSYDAANAHRDATNREGARHAAQVMYEQQSERTRALEVALAETMGNLEVKEIECSAATATAERHAADAAEWAAKARAIEAVAESDARQAASRQAALREGLAELDEAVGRAAADTSRAQAESASLCREISVEETIRQAAESQLAAARRELDTRHEEEEAARVAAANARAAEQALHQASLQRELRQLQRQLVYPNLALTGPEATWADGSSDALWAGLLSEPGLAPLNTVRDYAAASAANSAAAAAATEGKLPPSLSFVAESDDGDTSELQNRVLAFASDTDEIASSARAQHERMLRASGVGAGAPPAATPTTRRGSGRTPNK